MRSAHCRRVRVLFHTGMREGELLGIQWDDLKSGKLRTVDAPGIADRGAARASKDADVATDSPRSVLLLVRSILSTTSAHEDGHR